MKNLLAKTVAGFLFLMLMMTLALFLTAGSAAYWQGWAYLATFAGCTLWITLDLIRNDQQLLERRVKGGPVAEKQRNQQQQKKRPKQQQKSARPRLTCRARPR